MEVRKRAPRLVLVGQNGLEEVEKGASWVTLNKNAYTPRTLAAELHNIVSRDTIRRAIASGDLIAGRCFQEFRIGRTHAEHWLNNLPLATEPTGYHAPNKRLRPSEALSAEALAEEQSRYLERRRRKKTRPN